MRPVERSRPAAGKPELVPATEILDTWAGGAPPRPEAFTTGTGRLGRLGVGPECVVLIGGRSNLGKSALAVQLVGDALRAHPDLRAVVWSGEMPPARLLARELSRHSGVPERDLRAVAAEGDPDGRVAAGRATLAAVAGRLDFADARHDLPGLAAAVAGRGARLVLVDYLQIIRPGVARPDQRETVEAVADGLRRLAAGGVAVVAVAAVTKDAPARPELRHLKDSAAVGYAADEAYMLSAREGGGLLLRHVKSRYDAKRDAVLDFNAPTLTFTARGEP